MTANKSLGSWTAKAGIWTVGSRFTTKAIDFASLILLARLLGPADFGLVAMAMTLIFIVEAVLELPLVAALVRIETPTPQMLQTAFTLGLVRGLLLASALSLAAWPLAHFYREPRLVSLTMVLALAPVARGLISPAMICFTKKMNFRPQVFLEISGKFAAFCVAATVALTTKSYWAIALVTVLTPSVMLVTSYIVAPMRPRLTLAEWPVFSDMVGWNFLSQTLSAINWQVDRFVLPRFTSTGDFGHYAMANDLSALPNQLLAQPISQPLNVAFVEALSRGHLKETYLKAMSAIFMVLAPALIFASLMAPHLIAVFLGSKWYGSAPIMSALMLTAVVGVPTSPMSTLAVSLNQSRRITFRNFAELSARVPLTIFGVMTFGAFGAVWAKGLASIVVLCATMSAVKSMTGLSFARQVKALAWPLVALAPGCAFLWLGRDMVRNIKPGLLLLVIAFVVYAALYVGMLYVLRRKLGGVTDILDLLKRKSPWGARSNAGKGQTLPGSSKRASIFEATGDL